MKFIMGDELEAYMQMVLLFFFLCVYIHMFRGLYYGSFLYPRQLLWKSGVILFLLMVVTAFLGYVLP